MGAADKRRGGRLNCERLTCEWGDVDDLSAKGMCVLTRKLSGAAEGEEFDLTLRGFGRELPVRVRICRIKPAGLFKREVGVQFLDPDEHTRSVLWDFARAATKRPDQRGKTSHNLEVRSRSWEETAAILNDRK